MLPSKLVFIVSAPRSGSTWLQLLLSQHDAVVSCQETHLFSSYLASVFNSHEHYAGNERGVGLSNILPNEDILALARDFAAAALAKVAAHQPGARVLVEKTPAHIRMHRAILSIFPDAYFIELVRDPRAVVASLRAVDFGNWTAPGILANVERWRAAVLNGQALATATRRHIRVRYEDLLQDGVATLGKIWAAIGEPCTPDDLRRWLEATRFDALKARDHVQLRAPWDMQREPRNFYRNGRPEGWKGELTRRQIAIIEAAAAPLMPALGYARIARDPLINWRARLYDGLARMQANLGWYRARL
ncbi:MAG: sulfotransferase [Alphaproteobacteria bacterium]|nr:MAG: sulfotransferase [Alphaproteobacteria bacterium]